MTKHGMIFQIDLRHKDESMVRMSHSKCAIPEDAVFKGVYYNREKDCIYLKFWHPSFPIVPEGTIYPVTDAYKKDGQDTDK